MVSLFANYEIDKLVVHKPDLLNWGLLSAIIALSIMSSKQKKSIIFLDRLTTDQVRGVAILMVVLGHLWEHVAQTKPGWVMSGDGVAAFLVLSGYGITKSLTIRWDQLGGFVMRRVRRVMLPYWVATFVILLLDYVILNRTYSLSQIILSLAGINLFGIMHHFDYVRWYITFLLFWYGAAVSVYRGIHCSFHAHIMLVFSLTAFLMDYYILDFGWYQFFAFPIGCLFAEKQVVWESYIHKIGKSKSWWIFLIFIAVFVYVKSYLWNSLLKGCPSICIAMVSDLTSVMFSFCLIGLLDLSSRYSRFLCICGEYSYEIFLLHGVFLVKYNPFFQQMPLPIAFGLYLVFILAISGVMENGLRRIRWFEHA